MFESNPAFCCARTLSMLCASLTVLLMACSRDDRSSATSVKEPSHDVSKLAKRVNLIEVPQAVTYKVSPMGDSDGIGGPTDYTLVAVLQYDEDTLSRLKGQWTRVNAEARIARLPVRPDWFQPSILAAIARCSEHWCIPGDEYSSAEFMKGGFVTGNVIVPEGQNVVILVLRT
jgi:hypothetical protein